MRKHSKGFTLLEMLVVMAILGLLASLIGPQVMRQVGSSKTKTAALQIEEYATALDLFKLDVGRYPTTQEGLEALIRQPSNARFWNGPYLSKNTVRDDPWGFSYNYRFPGEHGQFDLYSLGADNKQGGNGEDADVTSWE